MLEGLPPHAPTRILRLATDERRARALTDLLGETFDPAETAVAAFEAEDGATWRVEAYFRELPDDEVVRDLARQVIGDVADEAVFATLDATDWVQASLDGLRPVRVGRVVVHGAHDRAAVRPHEVGIEIEAALAFGTGHHGTTSGCLGALAATLRRRRDRPARVLDVGTGTGVLAIAAARAFGARVVAGDIDPVAVEVARANARLNGARRVAFYTAPGVRHPAASRRGGFDLVVANILARPLARLAPSLARVLAPGGTLVLSGLLLRDVPGILSAYRGQGLALRSQGKREGWATLVLARGGAAPRRRSRP